MIEKGKSGNEKNPKVEEMFKKKLDEIKKEAALKRIADMRSEFDAMIARKDESYFVQTSPQEHIDGCYFVFDMLEQKINEVDDGMDIGKANKNKLRNVERNVLSLLNSEKRVNQEKRIADRDKLEPTAYIEFLQKELNEMKSVKFAKDVATKMWLSRIEACEARINEVVKNMPRKGKLKSELRLKLNTVDIVLENDLKDEDSRFRNVLSNLDGSRGTKD